MMSLRLLRPLLLIAGLLALSATAVADDGRSYDVERFYVREKLEKGCKVLKSMDRVEDDVEALLIPTEPMEGEYEVEVQEIDFNLYWVVGSDLYVETRSCFELAYIKKKAVLIVESPHNFAKKGKLIFGQ